MKPRILITGGAGFIGSHIVEHFQGQAEIIVLDDLRTGYRRNLAGLECRLIEGSILDDRALAEAMQGVGRVFHLAAMISVPESVQKPAECAELNIEGTRRVLAAASRAGVKKVLLASSAAIYGDNPLVPKLESMPPEPKSPYAESKLAGEHLLEEFQREHGLATASLRFFNVFGPRQDPQSAYAAAVPIFIARALRSEDITIYGDGEQTRDFIYVKDIVGALDFMSQSPASVGTYNVGYGRRLSIKSLAQEILNLTASKSALRFLPGRPGDVMHSVASADKLRQTGWLPAYDVPGGLAATIRYFQSLNG